MGIIKKRGIFFSLDALIALLIILLVILLAIPTTKQNIVKSKIDEDILVSLSSISAENFDNVYVQSLIASKVIADPNKSLLEIIGSFYVTDKDIAKNITDEFLSTIKTKENIGIWLENNLISSLNSTSIENAKQIDTSRQIISGAEIGKNITGFSARAFLSSNVRTSYSYFGGYIGDGNITLTSEYNGTITGATLEISTNKNFNLYINDVFAGNYNKSPSTTSPIIYDLSPHQNKFVSGINYVSFRAEDLYIAGGFLKIKYKSEPTPSIDKHYFPGIQGLINIYDGLYIPGNLTHLKVQLRYRSNYPIYITFGNKTITKPASPVETTLIIDQSELLSILNYSELSYKTIPLRLALENISYVSETKFYIISIADLSGGVSSAKTPGCSGSGAGLCAVKKANYLLVNSLAGLRNTTEVGLLGMHQGNINPTYSHSLTTNKTKLNNTINVWDNQGNLDLCYGIKNATDTLKTIGTSKDKKIGILLGTKFPNSCLGSSGNIHNNTYNLACEAWTNHSITINTIGIIGGSQNDANLNILLRDIASCTNGTYYNQSASTNDLVQLYNSTINDILNLTFFEQTSISNSANSSSELYKNSYIEYNYSKENLPFGLTITSEKNFDNEFTGIFEVPSDTKITETRVISYSGSRWTNLVSINNQEIYNLSKYGSNYLPLGDPYAINIPNSQVSYGNNTVKVTTGLSPINIPEGSINNKIIYTIIKNISIYSPISSNKQGCTWTIHFEDNTNATIKIPQNYTGSNLCTYSPTTTIYDNNDALQVATHSLLKQLDLNSNGKIDFLFDPEEIVIEITEINGIPFPWSTEIQVRRWL